MDNKATKKQWLKTISILITHKLMRHLGNFIDLGLAPLTFLGPEILTIYPHEYTVASGSGWSRMILLTRLAISKVLVMVTWMTRPLITYPVNELRLVLKVAE